MINRIDKKNLELSLWTNLALDICPHCQNKGLSISRQFPMAAILVCLKCHRKYLMSVQRNQGAYQLNENNVVKS